MDRSAEAGKNKGGGVCFFINRNGVTPRNISILSRSCSPHLEHLSIICRPFYLPREFTSILVSAVYIPPQADTSVALSNLHDEISGICQPNIPTLLVLSLGTLTRPTSRKSCRTFISIYPVQPEDRIHWITATLRSITPTKPTHCRLLANQIMSPSFSRRNTNKRSLAIRRWMREVTRWVPPLWSYATGVSWMTSTGTCSGRVHLTSAITE